MSRRDLFFVALFLGSLSGCAEPECDLSTVLSNAAGADAVLCGELGQTAPIEERQAAHSCVVEALAAGDAFSVSTDLVVFDGRLVVAFASDGDRVYRLTYQYEVAQGYGVTGEELQSYECERIEGEGASCDMWSDDLCLQCILPRAVSLDTCAD